MKKYSDFKKYDGYFIDELLAQDIEIEYFADRSTIIGSWTRNMAFIDQYNWSKSDQFDEKVMPYIQLYIAEKPLEGYETKIPQFIVPNLFDFMMNMGRDIRKEWAKPVIAVTGSAGKSTTKNMIVDLLGRRGREVLTNRGNHNNAVSTPYYLMNLERNPEYCVLEIAATSLKKGTAKYADVNVGIITNIGEAHLGTYQTIEKLIEVKSTLIDSIIEGGTAILNKDLKPDIYHYLYDKAIQKKLKIKNVSLEDSTAEAYLIHKKWTKNGYEISASIENERVNYTLPIGSSGAVFNSLAALLAVKSISLKLTKEKLDGFKKLTNLPKVMKFRMYRKETDQLSLIDDTHNASIPSMKNAIEFFSDISTQYQGNKILILSQVADLGGLGAHLHNDLLKQIKQSNADYIFLYAKLMKPLARELRKMKKIAIWFDNLDDLVEEAIYLAENDSLILMKGSRSGSDFIEIYDKLDKKLRSKGWDKLDS